ncbi:hypothetical protein BDZ89DRAFT_188210 [Hymenopellis radicata]|nr:hypothetical protein BDZ89DRAFT_188210 [Hymenopellis radicata]
MSLNPDTVDPILSREPSIDHSFPSNSSFHVATSSEDTRPGLTLAPLSDEDAGAGPEDDFDVFDLELIPTVGGKTTELSFRKRNTTGISSARPTYKVEKRVVSHFLGKKNMSITISRNEGLSATTPPSRSRRTTKGYASIFEALDANPRQAIMAATPDCVLSDTTRGGRIVLTSFCGAYDPQNTRSKTGRDGGAYHFFPLVISDETPPENHIVDPLSEPNHLYFGGGHFLFDAHSQGRKELLFTLWCTRYEKRHRVQQDDILVAELRLPQLPGDLSKRQAPSWSRLMKERHASLHISKSAIEQCFSGENVRILVNGATPGKRHFFAKESGAEIVVSAVALSLLAIEHEGLESKKWVWLNTRETMEQPLWAPSQEKASEHVVEGSSSGEEGLGIGMAMSPEMGMGMGMDMQSRDTLMTATPPPSETGSMMTKPADWTVMSYKSEISLRRAAHASEPASFIDDGGAHAGDGDSIYTKTYVAEPPMRHSSLQLVT